MSVVSEVKAELSAMEAKAGELAARLEPEAARLEALAGNPVVDALLGALHVPPSGLALAVQLIEGLAAIYPKPGEASAENLAAGA